MVIDNIKRIKWQLPKSGAVHWRKWDNEAVVFDSRSGDTHLLGSLATEIIRHLEKISSTTAELTAALVHLARKPPSEFQVEIAEIVDDLSSLALIEPVSF